ncbi:MAG: PocR ligand-binding domain-containing protein [Oscillospiraceae bacterium]|nr:PocR ligand-binding domain-containing protein [Oscillospiraceae bacterium]
MQNYNPSSLITEEFQKEILDSFAYATGFGCVFTDADGNHVGPCSNFCRFCQKINETQEGAHYCALSNKNAIELALKEKKPSIYICHAGLVNIEIPLVYQGRCVGAITAGQVLCREENAYPQDQIASRIHWLADPELAAYYEEIPVMSRQKIEATTSALSNLTNYVVQKLAYAQMQEQLAKKSEELLIAENQLKQAKLDALQKQVTPHFIFNVLNSVSRLLSMQEYGTAKSILDSFAQMMRYSLYNLQSSVLLEKELEYVHHYLSIQKIRFGDCIDYRIQCDSAMRSMRIPFFSLQPLVENSIEHGLLPKGQGGKLEILCSRKADCDTIVIRDDGVGLSEEQLEALRGSLTACDDSVQHVGLHNCYKRFQLMFDQRFSFELSSAKDVGTAVTITIRRE